MVVVDQMEETECSYIPIPQFYAGRSVFITGATGFMGKILVEKLLRSCPKIANIYLLMRPKRGQEVSSRLNDLLNSSVFDTIRKDNFLALEKVVPICGDITLAQLDISESDQELLCRNVSVVYHLAATVKFDEKLELAVKINMLGTRSLLELCHRMEHLDALVHVSTAYSNCDRSEIEEVIYPPPYDPADIINLVNWLPADILDKMTPLLIGERPNSYTLTKALAEQMILNEAASLPVAIVRPSIVVSCYNEPEPGWLQNTGGTNFLAVAIGNGLIHSFICEKDCVGDVVPVDFAINMIISTAWRTATTKPRDLVVYNCVSGARQPITWQQFLIKSLTHMIQHPTENVIWYPTAVLHTNRFVHAILHYLVHYLRACGLDFASWLTGKKQIMVKTLNRFEETAQRQQYFVVRQWHFTDDNVRELLDYMDSNDRATFPFDVTQINWDAFFEPYVLGVRKFLLKQNPKSLPNSRKRLTRLYWLHQTSKVLLVALIVMLIWRLLVSLCRAV